MKTVFRVLISIQIVLGVLLAGVVNTASAHPLAQESFSCASVTQIPTSECQALVTFYNSTNGSGWSNNSNWLISNNPGDWYGVNVVGNHVFSIQLEGNQLTGTIPTEIGNFPNLRGLYLNDNQLTGSIPASIVNLSSLADLFLFNNNLSGSIPAELGSLSNLNALSLWGNELSGSIPTSLGGLTHLQGLWLNANQLSGSIPTELGSLSELSFLYLQNNQFNGSIPSSLGNLTALTHLEIGNDALSATKLTGSIPATLGSLPHLTYLSINQTNISGAIPPELGNLTQLKNLYLYDNELDGSIPSAIGNLSNLEELSLWGNNLSGSLPAELGNLKNLKYIYLGFNQLSGSIPTEIGTMTSLQELWLHFNQFSGTIPASLGNLSNLHGMWLRSNQFSGSIPPELGNLSNLNYLYLDNNQLTGSIPPELGNLTNLSYLFLGQNLLEGSIPSTFGNLSKLQYLDIRNDYFSTKKLSGSIPAELGNLSNLKELVLNNNQLSGSLPSSLGNLTKLEKLSLWDNQLSGEIPTWLGNLTSLKYLYLGYNQFTGTIPDQIGNLTNLEELWLYNNQLTGAIPASMGNLTSLTQLRLDNNHLSGSIPTEFGNLTNIRYLYLYYNDLTGGIPTSFGNLTALVQLLLDNNDLSGSIPAQIGYLTNLQYLSLYHNQLSGTIPSSIGNLTSLTQLFLDHNLLSGDVPTSFTQLVNLYNPAGAPNGSDGLTLDYNYLNTPASTPELATFLAQKDPDWASTQSGANPVPVLTEINPSSVSTGAAGFTLTVTGSSFINGAVVAWDGVNLTTTYVSATQLTATVPAANVATGATHNVTVVNPVPGGGASNALTFTVNNPAPILSTINPTTVIAGSADFTLTVDGSNFVSASKVRWNGADLTTTYVSATRLTAVVPAANVATFGTADITVFNPAPNGGTSSAVSLAINNPVPTVSSINPTNALIGSSAFTLTVNGTGYTSGSVVRWNNTDLTTTYISATQLTASVPAANLISPATVDVTVFTPTPGGGTSNANTFSVNNPVPGFSTLNPTNVDAGSAAFTLNVTGTNFISGSVVRWNGADLVTTFVTTTSLTAAVPAANVVSGGTYNIAIFNPAPGGGTSGVLTFDVNHPTPNLTGINPSHLAAGSASFTMTVTGTNFVNGSVVRWNGTNLTTTYVSSTQLTAAVLDTQISAPGSVNVTVFNPTPGGGLSSAQVFTIDNPLPTASLLNPANVLTGSAGFTLNVTGTNFINSSVVRWNGTDLTTTYVSTTELAAIVPAANVALGGTADITVFTPTPGGGTSGSLTFTINNPEPTLTTIDPISAATGSASFTLTVNGTNFVTTSKVRWNGTDLTTTYVSTTQLTATVPAANLSVGEIVPITVFNPTPAGGTSSAVNFTINNPSPALASLNPSSVVVGSAGFTLTVNGNYFVTNSVVRWNGSDLATTYVNSTRLTAVVPAASISSIGTAEITVFNPAPSGGTSTKLNFAINNPLPVLASISPTRVLVGSSSFTMTLNGSNFIPTSVVRWNSTNLTTTYVTATELNVTIPAESVASLGTAEITVFNPTPGGGVSTARTFTIAALSPIPVIASLNPSTALRNGAEYTLTINGSNFVNGAVVNWNGSARATTFVDSTKLTATILHADLTNAGTGQVTVVNPAPHEGDGTSNAMNVTILDNRGDVAVTLTDNLTQLNAGSAIQYTLTVRNSGPASISGVTVADVIPVSITNVTWICSSANSASCTASGSGNINDTVNLPSGGSVTYTISGTLSATATGTLTNTASAAVPSAYEDTNPANNQASDSTVILPYIPVTGGDNIYFPLLLK